MRKKKEDVSGGNKEGVNPWPYILGLVLIVFAVLAFYFYKFHDGFSPTADAWGQFGDYFGGILNPILSFCAFVGLLFTLRGQHSESLQVDIRHRVQVFDVRLFQMLGLFSESAKSTKVWSTGNSLTGGPGYNVYGHEAITHSCEELMDILRDVDHQQEQKALLDSVKKSVSDWRNIYYSHVENYFHNLKLLSEYAVYESAGQNQKKFALDVIGAQLNPGGRILLFYLLLVIDTDIELLSDLVEAGFFVNTYQDPLRIVRRKLIEESGLGYARLHELFKED